MSLPPNHGGLQVLLISSSCRGFYPVRLPCFLTMAGYGYEGQALDFFGDCAVGRQHMFMTKLGADSHDTNPFGSGQVSLRA